MMNLDEAKAYPITSIMDAVGARGGRVSGGKIFYSSPFSSDSNPSFCVYVNTNTYFDFANGLHGDSIDLYSRLNNCKFVDAVKVLSSNTSLDDIEVFVNNKHKPEKVNNFNHSSYLIRDDDSAVKDIKEYASGRGIYDGYFPSIVADYSTGEKVLRHSMMFLHIDESMDVVGAKFRFINPEKNRFTARGSMKYYTLENFISGSADHPSMYFVESETSANSLWQIFKENGINAVVISMGGVTNVVDSIPIKYEDISNRYVIIDYDGSEELYNKRIAIHKDLGEPIKLILPKGEDINSLYSNNNSNIILNSIK